MTKEVKARLSKGNIKLGVMLTFSKLMGNDVYNTSYGEVKGSCGHYCEGCKGSCYVKKSYRYPSVKNGHARNTLAMREDIDKAFESIREQIKRMKKPSEIVRINQSGEIESTIELAKWIETAREFPNQQYYLYTKNFDALFSVVNNPYIEIPNNITILISIWHEYGIKEYMLIKHLPFIKAFVYMDGYDYTKHDLKIETKCKAYEGGKLNHEITCDKCRKCFNRLFKVIGCDDH